LKSTGVAIGIALWEIYRMIKTDDLVTARGHNGVFRVCSLSQDQKTAEIELFNVSQQQPMHYRMSVPTTALSPFSEDASQLIVRQATED
jgi:hypothetical protein